MQQHLALSVMIFDDHDDEYNFGNVPLSHDYLIADIYISISMGTFGHRKYKTRGNEGIN